MAYKCRSFSQTAKVTLRVYSLYSYCSCIADIRVALYSYLCLLQLFYAFTCNGIRKIVALAIELSPTAVVLLLLLFSLNLLHTKSSKWLRKQTNGVQLVAQIRMKVYACGITSMIVSFCTENFFLWRKHANAFHRPTYIHRLLVGLSSIDFQTIMRMGHVELK